MHRIYPISLALISCNITFKSQSDDYELVRFFLQVDRLVAVAGPEEMVEFGHLFSQTTRKNLGDEHIWFSVVARPPQSRFTRVQRVCCCLCLLYTSMLGNALFYERADDTTGADGFKIGPFALTPQQVCFYVVQSSYGLFS